MNVAHASLPSLPTERVSVQNRQRILSHLDLDQNQDVGNPLSSNIRSSDNLTQISDRFPSVTQLTSTFTYRGSNKPVKTSRELSGFIKFCP